MPQSSWIRVYGIVRSLSVFFGYEAMVLLYNLFEGVTSMPELSHLFHAINPPKQVRFSVIECFSELSFCLLADSRSFVG